MMRLPVVRLVWALLVVPAIGSPATAQDFRGSIAGTISDEEGEPVAGVSVQAMSKVFNQGKSALQARGSAKTDDRGNYRLYDLPPGRYYVQAGGKNIMDMAMSMASGGAPAPRPVPRLAATRSP